MRKIFFLLAVALIGFTSCENEAGKGGSSSITGVVMVQEYNKDLTIKVGDLHPAQDVDVYLIYSNDVNEIYSDRFQTGWDGRYEFNYLREGSYSIYALSKDVENKITDELYPVFVYTDITKKDQVVEADTIFIID